MLTNNVVSFEQQGPGPDLHKCVKFGRINSGLITENSASRYKTHFYSCYADLTKDSDK